jgi:hypothetical protein
MDVIIGCIGLGVTIIGSAVGLGIKMGSVSTELRGLKEQVQLFISARNGGTQCQRHEDAIGELRRDMDEVRNAM